MIQCNNSLFVCDLPFPLIQGARPAEQELLIERPGFLGWVVKGLFRMLPMDEEFDSLSFMGFDDPTSTFSSSMTTASAFASKSKRPPPPEDTSWLMPQNTPQQQRPEGGVGGEGGAGGGADTGGAGAGGGGGEGGGGKERDLGERAPTATETQQVFFDLLGELIKFNEPAIEVKGTVIEVKRRALGFG